MTIYAIKDWETKFTKSELSRKVKWWRYVPVPINLNGEGFRVLMATKDGRATFGVFVALCELAANLPERGVLADERGPLSSRTIEIKTGIPSGDVEEAIRILSGNDLRWLVEHKQTSGCRPDAVRTDLPNPIPPNPTQPNLTKSISENGHASVPIGSGGIGKDFNWDPVGLERHLRIRGVNPTTAAELAPHAAKLAGINIDAELARINNDKSRKDKIGTWVRWIETAMGVKRDSVGSIVNGLVNSIGGAR